MIITNKVVVSIGFDFVPLLVLDEAGFELGWDDEEVEVESEEVETEVVWESVAEEVVESESASLKILASGEFGGRFNRPEKPK